MDKPEPPPELARDWFGMAEVMQLVGVEDERTVLALVDAGLLPEPVYLTPTRRAWLRADIGYYKFVIANRHRLAWGREEKRAAKDK